MEGVTSVVRKPSEKYGRFGLEDEPAGHWFGVVIPEKNYVVIGVSTVPEPTNQYQRIVIPVTVTYAVIIHKAEYPPAVARYTAVTPPSIIPNRRLMERPTGV
jgi:effector-binding domain-containing protein